MLSNMCVLQHYSRDAIVCQRYLGILATDAKGLHGWNEWCVHSALLLAIS
jgi:hypothetical protein